MRAKPTLPPAFWIALAAVLWATDALFRFPAVAKVDPAWIVLLEHALGTLILLPLFLAGKLGKRSAGARFSPQQWVGFLLVGGGGSALATLLFTAAFQYSNPSVVILLQKLQPILVILLAIAFLGERPSRGFFGWSGLALFSALALSSPDLGTSAFREGIGLKSTGVIYAVSAAALWALSTVVGKRLLGSVSFGEMTFWRYAIGFGATAILVAASRLPFNSAAILQPETLRSILYIGLLPGLAAMLAYYGGLRKTPASVATLVELLFPVGAVVLNMIFLNAKLDLVQATAGTVLLYSVTQISLKRHPAG